MFLSGHSDAELMPRHNGPILTITHIMKFFVYSATEAKLAAMFINAKKIVPLCQTLIEMRWLQPLATLQTNNYIATGVTNNTFVPHQTKFMDLWFYWLHCRTARYQFRFYWVPRGIN